MPRNESLIVALAASNETPTQRNDSFGTIFGPESILGVVLFSPNLSVLLLLMSALVSVWYRRQSTVDLLSKSVMDKIFGCVRVERGFWISGVMDRRQERT